MVVEEVCAAGLHVQADFVTALTAREDDLLVGNNRNVHANAGSATTRTVGGLCCSASSLKGNAEPTAQGFDMSARSIAKYSHRTYVQYGCVSK
jgi:hypothetical protein